jgi:ABC-type sugar transport system ATPase subunit
VSLLAAAGLRKSFGGARALDGVDFELRAGEIHALAGENGAGKSTLIKILGGAVVPDAGQVVLDGRPLPSGDPLAVRDRGLSIVYQEFTLVPELTVAENVCLGRERGWPWLRRAEMNRDVQAQLDDLGVHAKATDRVRGLSVAQQQMIEIARATSAAAGASPARVLILDEPTSALSRAEVDRLMDLLRRLRARGLGIVYISHRLDEIVAVGDRVTVLRDGRHVATAAAAGLDRGQLIRWMVGRDIAEEFPARTPTPGAVVLDVHHLACPPRFHDVSFAVREGEIVALAGLVGAGRTSTALALAGALPAKGEVRLGGRAVRFGSPARALADGLAYVTEDRKAHGIFPAMAVADNITISALRGLATAGFIDRGRERAAATDAARRFDVRAASLRQAAATLSGGNQQKMLLARYLLNRPRVIVLDEPTRGVDVGARAEIYGLMNNLTRGGLAVLMISSDLTEVLGMADRIVVLRDGRTAGELTRAEATPEAIMALATSRRPAA